MHIFIIHVGSKISKNLTYDLAPPMAATGKRFNPLNIKRQASEQRFREFHIRLLQFNYST